MSGLSGLASGPAHGPISRYEHLFEYASDGVLLVEPDGHSIVKANRRASELYGYSPHSLQGLNILGLIPAREYREMLKQSLDLLCASKPMMSIDDCPIVSRGGHTLHVSITAAVVERSGETLLQFITREMGASPWAEAGASDPVGLAEINSKLLCEIDERKRAEQTARALALTDPLTQIANRRAFDLHFDREWRAAVREGDTYSVVFIDIDHFKAVNDTYGHPVGDRLLSHVAAVLDEESTRGGDFVARYGGEEFVVLMKGQDVDGAERCAERLRAAVSDIRFPHDCGGVLSVTASFGVANGPATRLDGGYELIKSADAALNEAKRSGRNCVVVAHRRRGDAHDSFSASKETQRLAALHALKLLDTPPEERFDRITRLARRVFGVPIALVSLVDERRQWFKSAVGLERRETPREISFCTHAIRGEAVFVVPDASQDYRFANNPLVLGEPYVRFYAGYPLRSADGSAVGTLCLIDAVPRTMQSGDIDALEDLASLVERELFADMTTA
ncbi:MAG: diguanylate cyclase [Gammaproteobacteria bacterium]|nr:diguanylate cyclase [Gammaproteobacteria bacterium]